MTTADPGTGGLPPGYPQPPVEPPPGHPGSGSPPPPSAGPAPGVLYSSFWQRVVAYLVDLVVMGTFGAVIRVLLGRHPGAADLSIAILTALVVHAVYLVGLWQTGQTLGMRILSLAVLRAEDGGRLTPSQAALRFIPFGLALIVPFIGPLIWIGLAISVATDPRGQGFHDRLAGSVVVRRG